MPGPMREGVLGARTNEGGRACVVCLEIHVRALGAAVGRARVRLKARVSTHHSVVIEFECRSGLDADMVANGSVLA